MSDPRDGLDLLETARRQLFTAVVGDVMDKMGLLHQFLPDRIRPTRDDTVFLRRAMTVLEADAFTEETGSNGCRLHVGVSADR